MRGGISFQDILDLAAIELAKAKHVVGRGREDSTLDVGDSRPGDAGVLCGLAHTVVTFDASSSESFTDPG